MPEETDNMPQSAGTTAAVVAASPDADHPRRPWWRRLTVVASAAALVGAMLASGGAAVTPALVKGSQSAYLSGEVVLEVDADVAAAAALGGGADGLGSGMALVSRSLPVMKNRPADLSAPEDRDEAPVCVASPIEPGKFRLTSPYGYRTHPIFGTYTMHTGTDFAAPLGTPIHAVTDGTVVYTGAGRLGRSSELVIIEHEIEGTTFYSWYVHMYPDGVFVEPGQQVRSGEVIAEVGNNGNSTGPHLHFEIHTSDAGLGLGLQKNTGARFTSLLTALTPDPQETPTEEETEDPTEEETEEPTDGETPSEEPTDEETEDPTEEESEEPTDGETPSEEPTDEESEEPTDGETPSEEPTDEESEEPTDGETPSEEPTDEESETPSPEPSETPTEEETDEESQDETEESQETDDQDSRAGHNPFPTRAYGTTVEAVSFFASLGLTMVAPSICFTPQDG